MNVQNWNIEDYRLSFGNYGFSTREEEMELVKSATTNCGDLDKLVRKCHGYVLQISNRYFRRYAGSNVLLEDVIQEGNSALLGAFKCYNNNNATRFTTYAFRRIKWKILNYLRDEFKAEHPVKLEDKYERGNYYGARLVKFSELSVDENIDFASASFDADRNGKFRTEFIKALKKTMLMLKFSDKERDIILSYHGIANGNGKKRKKLNFDELGEKHGFCGERIRQIYHKSLSRLKEDKKLEEFYC